MELLKDYDYTIQYHPEKANIVADALSRKSSASLANISAEKRSLIQEVYELMDQGLILDLSDERILLAYFSVRLDLRDRVRVSQHRDQQLMKIIERVQQGKGSEFGFANDGALMQGSRICVLNVDNLRNEIMREAHCTLYNVHLGSIKMYHDVKDSYWWNGIKRDIADFVSKCLTC